MALPSSTAGHSAEPAAARQAAGWRHPAAVFGLTALFYVLLGLAALPLAVAPGSASPIWPAAGLALVSVLVFGYANLGAVAIGAFCINLILGRIAHGTGNVSLLMPTCVALGVTLQAGVGALLVKRLVRQPLTLAEPRDVLMFFGAGLVSCLVSASVATAALGANDGTAQPMSGLVWLTWWLGDLAGVLVAAPVLLTLVGRPRDDWAPRRGSVGVLLALALLLLGLGVRQVVVRDEQRLRATFERDAASAAFILRATLQEPLRALEAMRDVFIVSDAVTRSDMRLASNAWLRSPGVQALGWAERVPAGDEAAFEARQRADGLSNFAIFAHHDGGAVAGGKPVANEDKLVIRYTEPLAANRPALGLNILSVGAARQALDAAIASGQAVASPLMRLEHQGPGEGPAGIVVQQAIYRGSDSTEAQRRRNLIGVVYVVLRIDAQMTALAPQLSQPLRLCLTDTDPSVTTPAMWGAAGCETRANAASATHTVAFAGRQWQLRADAEHEAARSTPSRDALTVSAIGLLAATMLGGFLLTVTGRTRRIETAVRERTAALESEVRERGLAEAALRESEQRFRSILDNVPIGMVYADLQGRVIQTNPSLRELTGYSEAELLELHSSAYTHPDDVPQDAALTAQLVAGEIAMYRRHQRYIAKSGATLWVRVTVSLLRDAQGAPLRIVAVVEDITEHLRLEEAEHAREVAESSNRAKSEFLSRMSHELRTPLNAMLGFAQLLELDRRHPLAESQRPWVAQIQQAGWHLLEMINDVLDLSRIESGHLRLHTEALDLRDLLGASLSMVEGVAQQRSITISHDLADGAAAVMGDATRVTQILTNLLSNAVKYNVDAGRIHITSRPAGADRVEMSVTDTGLGMTPEQLAQLFQPFNRLGRERSTQQEGTGIGLVIAQRLAELMGGSLQARSIAGEGSSFVLVLPRVIDADTVRSDLTGLETLPAEYHRRIVHYVEDNETNVEVMRGVLAQRPQVQMEVSITGLDSLAAMRASRPDLILLDMHLPDISGLELLRHLKADARMAAIPVVVVSADALAQQIEAAFEAGASHYLTKPVSVAELLAVLDALLEQMDTRFG